MKGEASTHLTKFTLGQTWRKWKSPSHTQLWMTCTTRMNVTADISVTAVKCNHEETLHHRFVKVSFIRQGGHSNINLNLHKAEQWLTATRRVKVLQTLESWALAEHQIHNQTWPVCTAVIMFLLEWCASMGSPPPLHTHPHAPKPTSEGPLMNAPHVIRNWIFAPVSRLKAQGGADYLRTERHKSSASCEELLVAQAQPSHTPCFSDAGNPGTNKAPAEAAWSGGFQQWEIFKKASSVSSMEQSYRWKMMLFHRPSCASDRILF